MPRTAIIVEILTPAGWQDLTADVLSARLDGLGLAGARLNYPRIGQAVITLNNRGLAYTPDPSAYAAALLENRRRVRIRAVGNSGNKVLRLLHSGRVNESSVGQTVTTSVSAGETWTFAWEARANFDSQHHQDAVALSSSAESGPEAIFSYAPKWQRYELVWRPTLAATTITARWLSLVAQGNSAGAVEYRNPSLSKDGGASVLSNATFAAGVTNWTITNTAASSGSASVADDSWIVFNGVIESIQPSAFQTAGEWITDVICVDFAEIVRMQAIAAPLQKVKRGDELAATITSQLPSGTLDTTPPGRIIERGKSTFDRAFDRYTQDTVALFDALLETATSEYGAWWVDRDGVLRWVNRDWLPKRALRRGPSSAAIFTLPVNPSAGATVRLDGRVYTFRTTASAAYDVQIGANADATATALTAAINGDGRTPALGADREIAALMTSYAATILASAPTRYYRFEETAGTTALDTSTSAANGTYVGGMTLGGAGALARDGGLAASFDGVNDVVTIPTLALDLRGSWSAALWVKPATVSPPVTQTLLLALNTATPLGYVQIALTDATGNWAVTNGLSTVASGTALTMGAWNHLAVSYDAPTTTLRLFLNGVERTAVTTFAALTSLPTSAFIGAGSGAAWSKGQIDEAALWLRALTPQQIASQYAARIATVTVRREGARDSAPLLALTQGEPYAARIARETRTVQNAVTLSWRPRTLSTGLTTLAQIRSPIAIPPRAENGAAGQTTLTLTYRDANGIVLGGENVIAPIATTDYVINESAAGIGVEYTSSPFFAITDLKIEASQATLTLNNTASGTLYATKLQIRGNAVYSYDPVQVTRKDAASIARYQERRFTQELPFSNDQQFIESLAQYRLARYATPFTEAATISVENRDRLAGVELLGLEIGDVVRISDVQSGLSAALHVIVGISASFTPAAPDAVARMQFTLERLDQNMYWVLGDSTYGALGASTKVYI